MIEFLYNFDFTLSYIPGKGNMVADALSRKGRTEVAMREWKLVEQLASLHLEPVEHAGTVVLSTLVASSDLYRRVKEGQLGDIECEMLRAQIEAHEISEDWTEGPEHELAFRGCLVVAATTREEVMRDFHHSRLAVHLGGTKMYHAVRTHFWWTGLKRDVATFVARCLTCQQVKAEHQRPAGQL